jgi:hypothetical protein
MVPLNRDKDIGEVAAGFNLGCHPVWKIAVKAFRGRPEGTATMFFNHEKEAFRLLEFIEGQSQEQRETERPDAGHQSARGGH